MGIRHDPVCVAEQSGRARHRPLYSGLPQALTSGSIDVAIAQ
jgi:hypothetical protein